MKQPEHPSFISDAIMGLLFNSPFFAYLLLERMVVIPYIPKNLPWIQFAATDGKRMWINAEWFKEQDMPTQIFVLAHECCHAMYMHPQRAKHFHQSGFDGEPFNPMIWNVATDAIINDTLARAGVGLVDKNKWIWTPEIDHNESAENAYRKLFKKLPKPPEPEEGDGGGDGGGQGQGEGSGAGQPKDPSDGDGGMGGGFPMPRKPRVNDAGSNTPYGKRLDDHIEPGVETESDNNTETEWRISMKKAAMVAKSAGKLPADFERFIGEITEPKVDWRDKLRHVVTRKLGQDRSTMRRPNRRRMAYGKPRVYMPSREDHGAKLIVVGGDTSGSIGEREIGMYLSEMTGIISDVHPEKLIFIWIDADIQEVIELDNPTDIEALKRPKGGGGTDFRPVFRYIEKEGLEPDVCVYCTDLYGQYPREEPPYPVVWVCTTDEEAAWGETVHIDD